MRQLPFADSIAQLEDPGSWRTEGELDEGARVGRWNQQVRLETLETWTLKLVVWRKG